MARVLQCTHSTGRKNNKWFFTLSMLQSVPHFMLLQGLDYGGGVIPLLPASQLNREKLLADVFLLWQQWPC